MPDIIPLPDFSNPANWISSLLQGGATSIGNFLMSLDKWVVIVGIFFIVFMIYFLKEWWEHRNG